VDDALLELIFDRLDGFNLPERTSAVLLAACESVGCLAEVLGGASVSPLARADPQIDQVEPAGAYLRSLEVQAFRGIGEPTRLPLTAGPGLTVVTGRNGSGKSSFADALELLLTGGLRRWDGLPAVWKDGWRNMHVTLPTELSAEIDIEDAGPAQVRRVWAADAGVDESSATVQVAGEKRTGIERLAWADDLVANRPFLSHAELEVFFTGRPSDLYELLASVLGLDDLTETGDRLAAARRERENALKAAKAALHPLLEELDGFQDERAAACRAGLAGRSWDLDAVAAIATGTAPADPAGDLARLRRISQLVTPTTAEVSITTEALETAAAELEAVAQTDAGRAAALAGLLRTALAHHAQHGDGPCPVCRRPSALDGDWQVETEKEAARLEQEAHDARTAEQRARSAWSALRRLVQATPEVLTAGDLVGTVDVRSARGAWQRWAALPDEDGPGGLRSAVGHLTATWDALVAAVGEVARAASDDIAAREDRWGPFATRLASWCLDARQAQDGAADVASLKAAERWLKDATDDIRNARFLPLAEQAREIWTDLRQESNVEVGTIRLTGSTTRRQVTFDVKVDGSPCAGLSVMSQGEVNALALSVFLPRATLAASPFRFLVIDDPVQAMDSAKVDGLARVLERVARGRQIVVFTHDDRLPEALRRLEIAATVLEVTRRPGSEVTVRMVRDPVSRALKDAADVSADRTLPQEVAARVVGALCRTALEAAFTEITRRRMLCAGRRHEDVEAALAAAKKLYHFAALAMFDDIDRTNEVLPRLARMSRRHASIFQTLNGAAHGPVAGDLRGVIDDTRRLVEQLRTTFA
jgi:recombinational DNA repair ATPase RecF